MSEAGAGSSLGPRRSGRTKREDKARRHFGGVRFRIDNR